MAYKYINSKGQSYFLHTTEVTLRGSGKKQQIFFFAREEKSGSLENIPEGYIIVENKKTGLPVLKKG